MTANKIQSKGLQVATFGVGSPSLTKTAPGPSHVDTGSPHVRAISLGKRAEAARTAAASNQPPTTSPMSPARQTQAPHLFLLPPFPSCLLWGTEKIEFYWQLSFCLAEHFAICSTINIELFKECASGSVLPLEAHTMS